MRMWRGEEMEDVLESESRPNALFIYQKKTTTTSFGESDRPTDQLNRVYRTD